MKPLQKFIILTIVALTFRPTTVAGENATFKHCLENVKNGSYGIGLDKGGTDNQGRPVNVYNATGMTYGLCLEACGSAQEPFSWVIFSQQFSAWLLPWLALISQLPFGANDKLDNLESVLLTVGSPVLAAYSLALTVLNGRWIARRFAGYTYPNVRKAVHILSSLQQSPLEIDNNGALLASLVVLPENDKWWSELEEWINHTHTWSISAVTNIAWVVIAYIFTLIDSFTGDITQFINANGLGVGSLWLWLLPIVVGWLQISPKCDSIRLSSAIQRANSIAYVATDQGRPTLVKHAKTEAQAVELTVTKREFLRRDEECTTPICNYARFFPWVETVEKVSAVFDAASNHCRKHESVDGSPWVTVEQGDKLDPSNRVGNATQVRAYCMPRNNARRRSCLGPKVLSRIFVASALALMLQWGTAGAAILVVWFTPTRGLGCRSASYLLYAVLSTVVWMLLVISSVLSHYYTTMTRDDVHIIHDWPTRATKHLSIILRRLGKVIAAFNAIWILLTCGFQFSNFFDRCYCNSSVFWLRNHAYSVILFADGDVRVIKDAWIGGVFLTAGCATIYVLFTYVYINPRLPD